MTDMRAPFPYFGGKRRWAAAVWERFGDPDVYAEPFLGSAAMLLRRPGGAPARGREVVCDRDAYVVNFWRAMQDAPDEVARAADWPSFHQDLTARHRYLIDWGKEHADRVSADPRWYDAEAAGWWAWGMSNWIGGSFCASAERRVPDRIPAMQPSGGGHGCNAQVVVNSADDRRAAVGERLLPWFRALQRRLFRVIVLCRDWESAVTPTVLCDTAARRTPPRVAVFLDPPYAARQRRHKRVYRLDDGGGLAAAAWAWAQEYGDRYRIAYACMDGDVTAPPGWESETITFGAGFGRPSREQMLFSPACARPGKLW